MKLNGSQKKTLQEALISAFPRTSDLKQMVTYGLDENLEAIAGTGALGDMIFELINWAESKGRTEDLLKAAQEANPTNPKLAAFVKDQEKQENLAHLSDQVQKAHNESRWEEVARFGREIQELDPGFRHVTRQTKQIVWLAELYSELQFAYKSAEWEEALAKGRAIQEIDAEYRDVPNLMQQAEQKQLERLYAELQTAYESAEWGNVLAIGTVIRKVDPEYRDVPILMQQAKSRQQLQSESIRREKKILDAAIRREVRVGEATLLLVLVRDRDSKGLYAILELEPEYMLQEEDVRHSRPFKLYYPVDASGNLLPTDIEIVVSAPDFDPPTQSKIIEIPPVIKTEDELEPVEFMLTPVRTGTLQVIVEVYQKPKNIRKRVGSKPLATVSLESTSQNAPYRIVSTPLVTLTVPPTDIHRAVESKPGTGALQPEETSTPRPNITALDEASELTPLPVDQKESRRLNSVVSLRWVLILAVGILLTILLFVWWGNVNDANQKPPVTSSPTPIEFVITCGNGQTHTIPAGETISLEMDNAIFIEPNIAPENDFVASTGELGKVPGHAKEFSYTPGSKGDILNFTFANAESGEMMKITLTIIIVPDSQGLCS